jgi:hypothetical protein
MAAATAAAIATIPIVLPRFVDKNSFALSAARCMAALVVIVFIRVSGNGRKELRLCL